MTSELVIALQCRTNLHA